MRAVLTRILPSDCCQCVSRIDDDSVAMEETANEFMNMQNSTHVFKCIISSYFIYTRIYERVLINDTEIND